jgi:hypothetical protein
MPFFLPLDAETTPLRRGKIHNMPRWRIRHSSERFLSTSRRRGMTRIRRSPFVSPNRLHSNLWCGDERRRTCQRSQLLHAPRCDGKENSVANGSSTSATASPCLCPDANWRTNAKFFPELGTRPRAVFPRPLAISQASKQLNVDKKCSAVLRSYLDIFVKVCIDRPGVISFPCTDRGYDRAFWIHY